MLWTGDERGYMQKWDVCKLLDKLTELEVREQTKMKEVLAAQAMRAAMGKEAAKAAAGVFITGGGMDAQEETKFSAADV